MTTIQTSDTTPVETLDYCATVATVLKAKKVFVFTKLNNYSGAYFLVTTKDTLAALKNYRDVGAVMVNVRRVEVGGSLIVYLG